MKKTKALGNILFWLTLISPMFSFVLTSTIGESNIFGVAGIIRYSWIMLLFIPLGIFSILCGLKLKKNKEKYKKNFIISFICLPMLMIFGSYRFIFNSDFSYDINKVLVIEKKTNIKLPNEIKVATNKSDEYNLTYVKIISEENKETFEREIENNSLWEKRLNPGIKGLLPLYILAEVDRFDYFVFYNVTNKQYNNSSTNGEYEAIFIAYDCDMQRLLIMDNYRVKNGF